MTQPYDQYKPSGIDWLGDIPSHWEIRRVKALFVLQRGHDLSNDQFIAGPYPVYGSNGVIGYHNESTSKGPSVTVGRSGSVGEVNYVEDEFWAHNTTLYVKETFGNHTRYIFYVLKVLDLKALSSGSAVPTLNRNYIHDVFIGIPPTAEQRAIADYLDRKTAQIDDLVARKEQLLALLQQKRQAIINEAVTRGLDDNAPKKDSGIEWLGEIPAHWQVKKLKYIKDSQPNAFVDGPFGSNLKSEHYVEDGPALVVESGFITSGAYIDREFKTITLEHFNTIERSSCKKDDIIIAKIGANYGMSGILPELKKPAVVSGNSLKLTVDKSKYSVKYIQYALLFLKESKTFELIVNATAQPALSLGVLNSVDIAVPSLEEQHTIVEHIEQRIDKIKALSDLLKTQLAYLKAYRQSLISEVVTGKVDVRTKVPAEM